LPALTGGLCSRTEQSTRYVNHGGWRDSGGVAGYRERIFAVSHAWVESSDQRAIAGDEFLGVLGNGDVRVVSQFSAGKSNAGGGAGIADRPIGKLLRWLGRHV